MDVFAKQNAEARKRHASPEPTLPAPPPVHDPERPSTLTLADRRQRTPQPVQTQTEASNPVIPTSGEQEADGELGDNANRVTDLDAPKTPTSHELRLELERLGRPELVARFQKFVDKQEELTRGWHEQYRILKQREEARIKKIWVPLEEAPDVLKRNEEAARKSRQPTVGGSEGGLPRPMPDSGSEGDGDGSPPAWQRTVLTGLARHREGTEPAEHRENVEQVMAAIVPDEPWDPSFWHRPPKPNGKGKSPLSSSDGGVALPVSDVRLALEVKMLLLPALVLLSEPRSARDVNTIKKADDAARKAYQLVRTSRDFDTPLGDALHGRCCFYRGVCRIAKSQVDGRGRNGLKWFRQAAVEAKGVFEEAEWAEDWIKMCEGPISVPTSSSGAAASSSGMGEAAVASPNGDTDGRLPSLSESVMSPTVQERPGTAGSWVSDVWNQITRTVKSGAANDEGKPPPLQMLHALTRNPLLKVIAIGESVESPISPQNIAGAVPPRPGLGERIPTYSTLRSGSTEHNHEGIIWSRNKMFGKDVDMLQSPESMVKTDQEYADADSDIPNNIFGGHVPIDKLKPARGSFSEQEPILPSLPRLGPAPEPEPEQRQQRPPPPRSPYRIVNGAPSDSSSSNARSSAVLPVYEPATPGHSPTYQPPHQTSGPNSPAGHSPRRSIAFARLPSFASKKSDDGTEQQPSPTSSIGLYARRKLSQVGEGVLSAITTGRAADPLMEAEEGQSPFRSHFGGEGLVLRKRSGGSEPPKSPDEMV